MAQGIITPELEAILAKLQEQPESGVLTVYPTGQWPTLIKIYRGDFGFCRAAGAMFSKFAIGGMKGWLVEKAIAQEEQNGEGKLMVKLLRCHLPFSFRPVNLTEIES